MPIVGTAGHVDHGKSTLVLALTGRDPDRWTEEKERGLTIDLGFAWTEIDGVDIGFVDVPGHERFIKNMLAGVGGVDCALLVVAADSGWMPQTEEHAAVLDLLGTRNGIIALTRIDLVDSDTVEIATLEIMEEIEGTLLEGWPIVPVSAVTNDGVDRLSAEIARAVAESTDRSEHPLKMWVDRSFTVSGAGVVVTGTIVDGAVTVGDEVELLPEGARDTVRGLHHHDESTRRSSSGSRTALNLQNTKLDSVHRGTLVCTPGSVALSDRLIASMTPARSFDEIPKRGAFHLHIGTAHTPVTIRQIRGTAAYRVVLESSLPVAMGDRFILRDSGRQAVVGGGRVLEPSTGNSLDKTQIDQLLDAIDRSPDDRATALLAVRGQTGVRELAAASGGGTPTDAVMAGPTWLASASVDEMIATALLITTEYHQRYPLRPGVPKAELATQAGVALEIIDAVVTETASLTEEDGFVRQTEFAHQLSPSQTAHWIDVRSSLEQSFDVPRMSAIDLDEEVLHSLIRTGELIVVGSDLVFTAAQIEELHTRLVDLPDGFSVSQFKDEFGMTRRQAVPMLEWLDKSGRTLRSGDGRTLRRRP